MHYGRCSRSIGTLLLLLMLAACGGGGDTAPPPPARHWTCRWHGQWTIWRSSDRNAAGALTTNTTIEIEQSNVGQCAAAASRPCAVRRRSSLSRHTARASPRRSRLPCRSTRSTVPVGTTPALYKTNAPERNGSRWPTRQFSGNTVVGQVTSFSFGQVVVPPLTQFAPHWEWEFKAFPGIGRPPVLLPDPDGHGSQDGGLLGKSVDFGRHSSTGRSCFLPTAGRPRTGAPTAW